MTYRDLQIDFCIYTKFRTFDGDIVVDVVDDEIKIAAFSGVVDDCYEGEKDMYLLPGGTLFAHFEKLALANPMFTAAVNEAVEEEEKARREPDPDYLRDLYDERERVARFFVSR
jgi:hypothetical protein